MAFIDVQNLFKTYASDGVETNALNGVSFSIKQGEFVAIMGHSGSGKSTLLHILGFLDTHTAGTYSFDSKTFEDYSDTEIAQVRNRNIGFVFQAFNLLPHITVFENIQLPLVYSTVPEHKWRMAVQKAIEAVHLSPRANYPTVRLSGGEKQRTAIARALVNNPRLILADEPTGNLDTASGKTVMELLQNLHEQRGHTIILVTHDHDMARYAERIITLRDGKIESDLPAR